MEYCLILKSVDLLEMKKITFVCFKWTNSKKTGLSEIKKKKKGSLGLSAAASAVATLTQRETRPRPLERGGSIATTQPAAAFSNRELPCFLPDASAKLVFQDLQPSLSRPALPRHFFLSTGAERALTLLRQP